MCGENKDQSREIKLVRDARRAQMHPIMALEVEIYLTKCHSVPRVRLGYVPDRHLYRRASA